MLITAREVSNATKHRHGSTKMGRRGLFEGLESRVLMTATGLLGDANRDGTVDLLDFNTWSTSIGTQETPGQGGDMNGDGIVDLLDFDVWFAHVGDHMDPPAATTGVTAVSKNMTTFNELLITGTDGNDSIAVSQAGTTFTIVANGVTQAISGNFGDIAIHAGSGGSTISVNSSVTLSTTIYGGAGTDNLTNQATGAYTAIIAVSGGNDTLRGNGVNTDYWASPGDSINASSTETNNGFVHNISSFYQPWSSDPSSPDYVPLTLQGQNLRDPLDTGAVVHYANQSLFGTGISFSDLSQGSLADCYLISAIQSVGYANPDRLRQMIVDLGDGTYAVQMNTTGTPQYVRVDGDFSANAAHPGSTGSIWGVVFEKAVAMHLYQANTFASIAIGFPGWIYWEVGLAAASIPTFTDSNNFAAQITAAIASHKALTVSTSNVINAGAPLIASHCYAVIGAYVSSGVCYVQIHNPWGFDGAGNDSNSSDGILTLPFSQFQANFSSVAAAQC